MLYLYMALTIIFFSCLSLAYKAAQAQNCSTAAFVCILNLVAAAISIAFMSAAQSSRPAVAGGILALGAVAGLASALCLGNVVLALKRNGPLAIVSTLVNLSILIPIVFATLFMGEILNWPRAAGLFLFVVFVMLLNPSAAGDGKVRPGNGVGPSSRSPGNWLLPAFAAFFLNGIVLITQRGIGTWHAGGENLFLLSIFLTSAFVCSLVLIWQRRAPGIRDVVVGGAAGIVGYGGNFYLIRSLSMSDSYQVFPLTFGAWMVAVAVLSRIIFGERLNRRSSMALAVGIVAIVMLNIVKA